jgi:two-component SAPR family response regulator
VVRGLILSNKGKNKDNEKNNEGIHNPSKGDPKKDKDKPLAKLLVVDDNSDTVQVLKIGLIKNRFLIDAYTNPNEALQNFKSNPKDYCLLLSDIRMPALSGIQLARKVKEINRDVKIILMTSFEIRDNEFSKVFPSIHVDGFVQKPISINDLTNKILRIIGDTKKRKRGLEGILNQ